MEEKRIKILLVDDREDNLFSIETVLERDGYDFRKAKSGNEALKILLKEVDFTLILMDVQMPGINGFETASLIYEREKLRHIPIIFITANDYNEDYVFKGYQAGAVDYIYKPINPELLRAKVSVFVELYRKTHLLIEHEKQLQQVNTELEERVKERTEELSKKNFQLEAINAELTKVNNELDSFVYAASHDLKAPISNIEGLLTSLLDCMNPQMQGQEDIQSIFGMLNESILRFKKTIQDLTEITKIQKNLEEDINEIDILEAVEDVKISIRQLVESSGAVFHIKGRTNCTINFSRKNLLSILYNLISNAIKYRQPDKTPEIKIEFYQDNNYLVLSVEDNGLGFNPAEKSKLFSMFKRLHNHVEGSGIGLYIVKKIIENSGGRIDADSIQGKGSVFKVYFPMDCTKQEPEEENAQKTQVK